MRVGLFVTCLVDLMRPSIGMAALKLLENAGCEVVVPRTQTCCGQPGYNSGDRSAALALGRKVLSEFESCDYVVAPSGSCAGMIRIHYPDLFSGAPEPADGGAVPAGAAGRCDAGGGACASVRTAGISRASAVASPPSGAPALRSNVQRERMQRLCDKTYELTDFLLNIAKLDRISATFNGTVTYHDACSGLREMGIKAQPRALLAKVAGLKLKEMNEAETCCGFGGTFAVKFGAISTRLADNKCESALATGADAIVLGDLGCMLNIEGRLRRRGDTRTQVLHVAEMLSGIGIGEKV